MQVITAPDIGRAYYNGMRFLRDNHLKEDSRVGRVLVHDEPVTTVFLNPGRRVLMNGPRDANPFFHFVESIWMLAGERDGTILNRFVGDFTERFADDGIHLHGAYGWRWKAHFDGLDQIPIIIEHLTKHGNSRRAVLQMWDCRSDLDTDHLDIPCNTQIYFRIKRDHLDMMVLCRSNDIIWGLYGANAVHMSILMEFIASSLGIPMGKYYHVSFNFHAYENLFGRLIPNIDSGMDYYSVWNSETTSLVTNSKEFLVDCQTFINYLHNGRLDGLFHNNIFPSTLMPMMHVHYLYKTNKLDEALDECSYITAPDWQHACKNWIKRRIHRRAIRRDAGELDYSKAGE